MMLLKLNKNSIRLKSNNNKEEKNNFNKMLLIDLDKH